MLINDFLKQLENRYEIILVSKSERRKQLLQQFGIKFITIDTIHTDETAPLHLTPVETAKYIANKKAEAYLLQLKENQLVITCDTIVLHNGKILGKPNDRKQAIEFLNLLSNSKHTVISGVCIMTTKLKKIFEAETNVWFDKLSNDDIIYYVDNFKPFDKAGAYGIQEWIGLIGCSRIEGSFYNIMGLPVHLIYNELREY